MTKRAPSPPSTAAGHRKVLVDLLRKNADQHQMWTVWADFVEMAAIAISNRVDLRASEQREARYLAIAGRYKPEQLERFGQALGALALALDDEPSDVLGEAFMALELGSKWAGQFFTPFSLCRLMAAVQVDDLAEVIQRRGHVTANDPAVGAGATLIALAVELRDRGINYQQKLHVTGQDVDARAAHMAYVQLSLLHVPAIVIVGDTLRSPGQGAHWYTPAHVLGGWSRRLRGERHVVDALHELAAAVAGGADGATETAPAAPPATADATVTMTASGQLEMAWAVPAAAAMRRGRRRAA